MDKIKLLIVDDSVLFREILAKFIQNDSTITVVDKVGTAAAARDAIVKYKPDIMAINLEIPRFDAVAFLKQTLPLFNLSAIVIAGEPEEQWECIEAGAAEAVSKPITHSNRDVELYAHRLTDVIHSAVSRARSVQKPAHTETLSAPKPRSFSTVTPVSRNSASPHMSDVIKSAAQFTAQARETISQRAKSMSSLNLLPEAPKNSYVSELQNLPRMNRATTVIALGASTGGTEALEQVIRDFPANTPPVVIVQHMPAGFTKLYAERLNRSCKMRVKEAEDGDRLKQGLIIVGAGDFQLRVQKDANGYFVSSKPGDKVSGHCPSVDVLFNSTAVAVGKDAIGAILTGMGRDGADGLLRMREAGAFTIGQDKESCVVYGMPMEAYKIGAVRVQAPLDKISEIILACLH